MFKIIRFDLLLKYTAIGTVLLSVAIYSFVQMLWFPSLDLFEVITISTIVSTLLVFILLSPFMSRKIWAIWGLFNKSLFPDLNGTWEGEVTLEDDKKLKVRAVIRQTLLATQIDMHGETIKSITLETTPTVEQGQKKLYYMYRATPKNPSWSSYNGSTLFDIRNVQRENKTVIELTGQYYTNRKSVGLISIYQTSQDINRDVSFY